MATQMEQIQQFLLVLLRKIPDAQHQALNDGREVVTKDEVDKLNAEVKLLNEKFGEKRSTETVSSQIEEAVSKTSGDVLLPFQEAYPPRLKYLLMMSWGTDNNNGIFSTSIHLSGQLDERIARALDVDACLIPDKKYDPYQSCYWHVKIAPTDALNRLANEFHYKVVSSWSSGKYERIYWTLEHVGI